MGQSIVSPWIYYIPQSTTVLKPTFTNQVKSRLGLVGETLTGPAFQPTFIKNATEFTDMFGLRNNELDGITNFPRYELPYIANSFLNYSKGLFVTRVLGFSGYDAGPSWGITLKANFDTNTVGPTITGGSYSNLFTFTADSQGTIVNLISSDSVVQTIWNNNLFLNSFSNLPGQITIPTDGYYTGGTLSDKSTTMYDLGTYYTGLSITNFYLNSYNYDSVNDVYYGSTSGLTIYYSASTFDGVEDQLVALLKSRGTYNGDEVLTFKINDGISSIGFDTSVTNSINDVYGNFKLQWTDFSGVTGDTTLSFDDTSVNFINTVLGRTNTDRKLPIYLEDLYLNIIKRLKIAGKIRGLKLSLVEYGDNYNNYKERYQPSVTPWVVSQIKGSNISKLFRFWSVGDGQYTTNLFKVTVSNIRASNSLNTGYTTDIPDDYDDYKFDVSIRPMGNPDTNAIPFTNEIYSKCSMNPKSVDYIGKKIGTRNGDYSGTSKYVTVEINEDDENIALTFPAGFLGYPIRDYENTQSGTAISPYNLYKTKYEVVDDVSKTFLGLGDSLGYDIDMFKYQGLPNSTTMFQFSGLTNAFHMDINASGATVDDVEVTVDGVNYFFYDHKFEVGASIFDDEQNLVGTPYQNLDSRKFTMMPYGGFDGWDFYRLGRTNSNRYGLNGNLGILGVDSGNFKKIGLTNNTVGLTSDYYAFLEGIWTFKNSDYYNINLFATPGIDTINHNDLVEAAIDMIEFDRADSLYIVTTPDVDASDNMLSTEDIIGFTEVYDTTYAATYWPWVKIGDSQNDSNIFLPPTISVLTNIAKNDNTPGIQPWDATAGVTRGDIAILDLRVNEEFKYLSKVDVDYLYNNRINPLIKVELYQNPITYSGFKIWGNKTLSNTNYLTNRVNVRRLLLEMRTIIINTCKRYLFEPNDSKVRKDIQNEILPLLKLIKENHGISEYKLVFDTPKDMIDKGYLTGKIYLKPVKALEYIVFAFSSQSNSDGFAVAFNQE